MHYLTVHDDRGFGPSRLWRNQDGSSRVKDDWDRVRSELNDAIAAGKRFDAVARKKRIVQTDRQGVVTVTANGFGEIVDLAISDQALRHPQQLGDLVTEAVVKARRTGEAAGERLRKVHFPAVPSSNGLKAAVQKMPEAVDYHQLDYADTPEAKSAIAECGERLHGIINETREFAKKRLRCEIGTAAGYVETNLADTVIRITIEPDVPGKIGTARLSQQVLTAVKRASERASKVRVNTFKQALVESPARTTWRATGE